jgi:hypothetical protein
MCYNFLSKNVLFETWQRWFFKKNYEKYVDNGPNLMNDDQ